MKNFYDAINIRQATDIDHDKWDNFVNNHSESTPYHLFSWTKSIQIAYGFKSFNLIAEENNQVVGIFPMTMIKIPFKRPEMVALPYCDIGFPLSIGAEVQAALLKEAFFIARTYNAIKLEIRGEIKFDFAESHGYIVQERSDKVRMLLDLPDSSTDLWQGFKAKLRSQVRKAEKNGLTFQLNNDRIDDFYAVFSSNMRDLGSPVHSKKLFEEIVRQYNDKAKIGLVYHQGKAIGTAIILRVGNNISIPWASTLRIHNNLSPNMLLYWKLIEFAVDSGSKIFDFGRSTPDEGTYNFKAQWGAKPVALPWFSICLEGLVGENKNPVKTRQYVAAIWQKLPLYLTNYMGPKFRKYISL